ncbi:MAG TPA: PilZ domain-containing protein [Terriglobales bacterium]|nr:PilZ domain-containing protein [Terriglobales bacterium]
MASPAHLRRWPRHPVDLPVRVTSSKGTKITVPGRGTEMSEGGMALYAGIALEPGDLMEVEFLTPHHARMSGVVRSRNGFCIGLEFLTPLTIESEKPVAGARAARGKYDPYAMLRRKEAEIKRLRNEIAALRWLARLQP